MQRCVRFLKLWTPQMTAFVSRQKLRPIAERSGATSSREELERIEQERLAIKTWSESEDPFTWR
jgi:hypothetical protein